LADGSFQFLVIEVRILDEGNNSFRAKCQVGEWDIVFSCGKYFGTFVGVEYENLLRFLSPLLSVSDLLLLDGDEHLQIIYPCQNKFKNISS